MTNPQTTDLQKITLPVIVEAGESFVIENRGDKAVIVGSINTMYKEIPDFLVRIGTKLSWRQRIRGIL